MPRIIQKAAVYAEEDFRTEIRMEMARRDMRQGELALGANIPASTLSKRLKSPGDITVEQLRGIVKMIKPSPLIVLGLLGYSVKDIKKAIGTDSNAISPDGSQ